MTSNVEFDDAVECAQILQDLIKGIEERGMYSKESTLTFLNQALFCLPHSAREAALQSAQ